MPFWIKIKAFFRNWIWGNFFLNLSLVLVVFIIGIFIGIFFNHRQLFYHQVELRAKTLLSALHIIRQWNANYGGVYVEKKLGVKNDPYQPNPELPAADGRVLTLRNPAFMLKEISEAAREFNWFSLHLSSLQPLDPDNQPDDFEKTALANFTQGMDEYCAMEKKEDRTFYRAAKALWVEEGCMHCHAAQNFRLGEIRGALAVKFEITDLVQELERDKKILILLSLSAIVALLGVIYYLVVRLMRKIKEAQLKLVELATIDDLTGLYNRRYFYDRFNQEIERARRYQHFLSCLILDLDDFKRVNDTYGHLVGDQVLQEIAQIVRDNCRASDLPARFGGEEFILLLPETDPQGALIIAERLRELIARHEIRGPNGLTIGVTASFGVASLSPSELNTLGSGEKLIQRADGALYQAKQSGKNQVVIAPS